MYVIHPAYFKEFWLRRKTGLQIHHLHYGIIFILIAIFILIFIGKNIYVLALFGLGLGWCWICLFPHY